MPGASGRVVPTGTPDGVGPLIVGEVVEVSVAGVGVLRNAVDGARAWVRASHCLSVEYAAAGVAPECPVPSAARIACHVTTAPCMPVRPPRGSLLVEFFLG